jgi:hypothetical protein
MQLQPQFSLKRVLINLAPLLVIPFIAIFFFKVHDLYILKNRGVSTQATVTRLDTQKNQTTYSFSFNGAEYRKEFLFNRRPATHYPKVGDKWTVTVDPENPHRHVLGDPAQQLSEAIRGLLFLTISLFAISFIRILFASGRANPFKTADKEFKDRWEEYKNRDSHNK